nr:peptidoglycan-recognition protein SC1a-like isoform X2 [Onthophagus taurus]
MRLIRVNHRRRATFKNGQRDILPQINRANLVTTEGIDPAIKPPVQLNCISSRLIIRIIFVTIALIAISLTLIFTTVPNLSDESDDDDKNPDGLSTHNITGHEYYTRAQWGGRAPLWINEIEGQVRWVIISHTVTSQCKTFGECSKLMRAMQDMHVNDGSPNIGYNFVIGGDANVYEGRGWFAQNFHIFDKNSLAISFIGNYVYDEVTNNMIDVFIKMLDLGVELKVLHPNYRLIAHNQTLVTLSPGANIYKLLKKMSNFYVDLRPRDAIMLDGNN